MPKKQLKSKNSKKTAAIETTDYQLITLEENHVHQVKHENLIQRVWNSTVLFEDIDFAVNQNEKNENLIKEWQTYLSCDKIPRPFEPQNIRYFFDKSHHYETEDVENTINWMLAIDECSILNQDIDSPNMTKMFLKKSKIDFGQQYDIRICDTMELSTRIEQFLECANKIISKEVLQDIAELNLFVQNKICHHVDNLTYRVLSSEAAYMESIDVTAAEYSYHGKYFDVHLWTFQNVPIYLDPEETSSKTIELRQIKVNLVMPFSVLSENMIIRGLHYNFDHLSSRARYNNIPINDETERNLKLCLQKEWASQLEIQAEVKAKMIKDRADFEEAMRLKAEEEELKAKEAKKDDKPKKGPSSKKKEIPMNPKKLPKEPPIVTPDLVPQVRKDFLEQDSQDYSNAISKCHPHKLKLSKGEVNLRQFQILGGIYQINSLSKPKATNFPKLIMTWYKTDKHVEQKKTQISSNTYSPVDDILKFFEITFELPDCFCHWSAPIPCFFEEHQSSIDDVNLCEATRSLKIGSPLIINDFNLQELFTKSMMYDFLENSIPRVISSFKFPEDLHDEDVDKKSKTTLGRNKSTDDGNEETNKELVMQKQLLSFDIQNNPERLFPLFKNVRPVVILPIQEDTMENLERRQPYEYFSEFLSALESIKNSYQKSTFRDKLGNSVKIVAEEYERNIRRPRITTKLVAYEQTEEGKSSALTSLNKNGRNSVGSRKSLEHQYSLKTERLSAKASEEVLKTKPQKGPRLKTRESLPNFKNDNDLKQSVKEDNDEEDELFSKWSTTNIFKSVFSANEKKVTILTDRLGTFGFAFNRYQHFPFKSWSLQPCEENSDELELKIESTHALFRIYITRNGYRAFVTDFSKTVRNRKIYLEIKESVSDLRVFKKKLQEKFLNIFPEADAVWYVNGNFSEKHLAAELHTYNCMSLNASIVKFHSSNWNKLSNRRIMVLSLGEVRELEQDLCLVRVTPEDAMFVEIKEANNDSGIIELEYMTTWRNLEWYADLNQLVKLNFSNTSDDSSLKDQNIIIFYLRNLLHSIRLLSFS